MMITSSIYHFTQTLRWIRMVHMQYEIYQTQIGFQVAISKLEVFGKSGNSCPYKSLFLSVRSSVRPSSVRPPVIVSF